MPETNPFESPRVEPAVVRRPAGKAVRPSVTYALIGFALGTGLLGSLTLSRDPLVQLQGGVMFGGPLGLLFGFLLGRFKEGRL